MGAFHFRVLTFPSPPQPSHSPPPYSLFITIPSFQLSAGICRKMAG